MPGVPFIEVRLKISKKNEWHTLDTMRPGVSCLKNLKYPQNLHAYLSNLEGLGVVMIRHDIYMVGPNIYEPLEDNAREVYSKVEEKASDATLEFQRGKIEITPLGRLFFSACFKS
jgi:hypothetical protein